MTVCSLLHVALCLRLPLTEARLPGVRGCSSLLVALPLTEARGLGRMQPDTGVQQLVEEQDEDLSIMQRRAADRAGGVRRPPHRPRSIASSPPAIPGLQR